MTTLSTHDTKRAEDVRARLAVLAERPADWAEWLGEARGLAAGIRSDELDVLTEYFLWQTVVGAWPISEERLQGYALKAIRESKLYHALDRPQRGLRGRRRAVRLRHRLHPADHDSRGGVGGVNLPESRANLLGQKLVQLDDARRAGRLPGHRPRRPLARRPGQPPSRRLRRAPPPSRSSRRGRRSCRPARREAARHHGRPARPARVAGVLRRTRPRPTSRSRRRARTPSSSGAAPRTVSGSSPS